MHELYHLERDDFPNLESILYAGLNDEAVAAKGTTTSQFLSSQMVDNMILSIIPVILGSGIPLFNVIDNCHVISSQAYPSRLVQLRYEIVQQPDVSQKEGK